MACPAQRLKEIIEKLERRSTHGTRQVAGGFRVGEQPATAKEDV